MAGVHRERLDVADREVAAREELELQHRLAARALVDQERREDAIPPHERHQDRRAGPAVARLLDQREDEAAEAEHAEARADEVDAAVARVRRSAGPPRRISTSVASTSGTLSAKIQRHETWSTITPPASGPTIEAMPPQAVHEPIAAPRSLGGKAATMIASELGVEQRPGRALEGPRADQDLDGRRQRARERETPNAADADREHAPLAVDVAERAADQDQRAERQQVGVRDPLLRRSPPPRSRSIAGSATLTIVPSIVATAEPRIAATSVSRLVPVHPRVRVRRLDRRAPRGPARPRRRRRVGAVEEVEQRARGSSAVRTSSYGSDRERAPRRGRPSGCPGASGRSRQAFRLGRRVGVVGGLGEVLVARPRSRTRSPRAVGLARDRVGVRHRRCRPAAEAGDGQVERVPEEVHRALPCRRTSRRTPRTRPRSSRARARSARPPRGRRTACSVSSGNGVVIGKPNGFSQDRDVEPSRRARRAAARRTRRRRARPPARTTRSPRPSRRRAGGRRSRSGSRSRAGGQRRVVSPCTSR